jgi:hypothetical protein
MPRDLVQPEIAHTRPDRTARRGLDARAQAAHGRLSRRLPLPARRPGTFEEVFEQWTWALLGIHAKPCGFVNVSGYYDLMRQTIQHMADNGFIASLRRHADLRRQHGRGARRLPRLRRRRRPSGAGLRV